MNVLPPGITHRVVLMRHAQPEREAQGRCYGKLDVGLGEQGRAQARAAARAFASGSVAEIVTSPRVRATETAAEWGAAVGVEPRVDLRLAEIDFGEFEGKTYDEIQASYPDAYARWMASPTTMRFPGGEDFGQMKRRVLEALAAIRAANPGRAVGVVSHGGVGRIVLADALGMADDAIFRLEQSYAGVSVLDWWDEVPALRLLNWTP